MSKRKLDEESRLKIDATPRSKFRASAVQSTFNLEGKVFVITGASKGIGAAVARHCRAHGSVGLLLIDCDEENGQKLCSELCDRQCIVIFVAADLGSAEECKRAASEFSKFERIDGLVNCAGVTTRGSLADTSVEKWDSVLNINLRSAFLMTQAVTEFMKDHRIPGSIVNISSVHGHGGGASMLPYSVSKAGMICMTKNNAAELQEFGIRVNAVTLGWTVTDTEDAFQRKVTGPHWVQNAERTFPFGRLLQSEDASSTVGFLLSDASVMISGTVVDLHPELIVGCLPRQFGNN